MLSLASGFLSSRTAFSIRKTFAGEKPQEADRTSPLGHRLLRTGKKIAAKRPRVEIEQLDIIVGCERLDVLHDGHQPTAPLRFNFAR